MGSDAAAERRARRLEASVRRFVDENALWPSTGGMLVAVSGGPDSTALLLVLSRLAPRCKQRLVAAYFDHGLRGDAASREERAAVEALASATGVDLVTGSGDVRGRSCRQRLSIEAAARLERYEFLARVAAEAGCSAVATGHTASDQAETVLMHLLRGSGLGGLRGMMAKSGWPFPGHDELSLVRPLLKVSRDDTASYCRDRGAEPVQDESNASPEFLRNRIRNDLLPALREYNSRVEDALLRLAEAARLDQDFVSATARDAINVSHGKVTLPRLLLTAWHPAPRREALRLALAAITGDAQGVAETHIAALERLALQGRTGDAIDLPRGVVTRLTRESLELRHRTGLESLPEESVTLDVPGEAQFGFLSINAIQVEATPRVETRTTAWSTSVELDAGAMDATLTVRRWRPGDRIQPLGMEGTKKLQDLFVDERVARTERNRVPVFENERGLLWVGGLRIAEWAKPAPGRPVVKLSYRSIET
ncbi:MAG: tRNA lysidine(34) synthetase TilS [Dehalococcoidia bacterium]|nr:tRNA lysidine(34) synthetase TilS [Dehalococcoidia bacterium]